MPSPSLAPPVREETPAARPQPPSDSERRLRELLHRADIWRGFRSNSIGHPRSGFALLDKQLPGRGWPHSGLIELLLPRHGIGELQLLLPTLRGTRQCWVNPPFKPYAPALRQAGLDPRSLLCIQADTPADTLWALEQVLRQGCEDNLLGWCAQASMTQLRRLQLAAESQRSRLFLFRPAHMQKQPSPAVLRLHLEADPQGLYLRLLKSRGGRPAAFVLPLPSVSSIASGVIDAVAQPGPATAATTRPRPRAA